jgi:F1F0 ATPase subunit 2
MTGFTFGSPLVLVAALAAGFALGYGHFATLKPITDAFAEGAVARALGLQLLRWIVLVVVLIVCARFGALPLLLAALGLLVARAVVLRRSETSP